jgi:hypothetical protein
MRVERLLKVRHRVVEARTLAIQARDEDDSREAELIHLGPYLFRLNLEIGSGGGHEHKAVHGAHGRERIG